MHGIERVTKCPAILHQPTSAQHGVLSSETRAKTRYNLSEKTAAHILSLRLEVATRGLDKTWKKIWANKHAVSMQVQSMSFQT